MGSTLAVEQVNPRRVHSEVVCLIPFSAINLVIRFMASSLMCTALLGRNVPDADCVVDRHQGLDAGAEGTVVLLAQVVGSQVRALIDQVLNDGNITVVGRHHQGSNTVVIGRVHVFAKTDQQLDDLEALSRRP